MALRLKKKRVKKKKESKKEEDSGKKIKLCEQCDRIPSIVLEDVAFLSIMKGTISGLAQRQLMLLKVV